VSAGPIEQKAVAAPTATLVAGYFCTVLISAVPWVREHLTPDQQRELPIIVAFLFTAAAAYIAPHTHRPDLPPVVPPAAAASLAPHAYHPDLPPSTEPRHERPG
jgi:hypothetical protein